MYTMTSAEQALLERVNELTKRVGMLEREIFGGNAYAVANFDRIAEALKDRFALTRAQSMILRHLLLSQSPAGVEALSEVIEANGGFAHEGGDKATQRVHYHICKIRGVIGLHGVMIEHVRDVGYRLTEINRKRLMKAAGITRI